MAYAEIKDQVIFSVICSIVKTFWARILKYLQNANNKINVSFNAIHVLVNENLNLFFLYYFKSFYTYFLALRL